MSYSDLVILRHQVINMSNKCLRERSLLWLWWCILTLVLICIAICIMVRMGSATFYLLPGITFFPFLNVLNALNNKLECFSLKNQVSSHNCHHVGGGNGYSTINFCSLHWLNNLRWLFFKKAYLLCQKNVRKHSY